MGDLGVALAKAAFNRLGWSFREQFEADHGIDAQVEVTGPVGQPNRLLALQIKCGPSHFKTRRKGGWRFNGKQQHLTYWVTHQIPVVLLLVDHETGLAYSAHVTHAAIEYRANGWSINVSEDNVLDHTAVAALRTIAFAAPSANPDPIDEAFPLLPPSAVEMLSALRRVDHTGALRLVKDLTEGRFQPRPTVQRLLKEAPR